MKRASLHRRRFPTPLILNRCSRGRNAIPIDFIRQAVHQPMIIKLMVPIMKREKYNVGHAIRVDYTCSG